MQQSTTQEIGTLIDQLAAKLAVPAAHLWEVLSRQALAEAVHSFAVAAIWLGLAVAVAYGFTRLVRLFDGLQQSYEDKYKLYLSERAKNVYASAPSDPDVSSGMVVTRVMRFVAVALCVVAAINYAAGGWKRLANPEYYALQEVLSALK